VWHKRRNKWAEVIKFGSNGEHIDKPVGAGATFGRIGTSIIRRKIEKEIRCAINAAEEWE
jgi:hypothetical protein